MTPAPRPRPQIAHTTDLDEWVRHIVAIHFDPVHGTPFWIERARQLDIDARTAIRGYDDLALLGFFPMDALRTRNVLDFMPAAIAKDRGRLRVHETGGTTGAPARIAVRDFYEPVNLFLNWYLDEMIGFPRGGNWLFIGPTGPHGVADSTQQMAQARGGMCYVIDLDPRFIKLLYQQGDMRTVGLYMKHIREQAYAILDTQDIDVLGTTPILIQALAPELKERGYRFSGLMYGGTQLSPDLFRLLRTEFFPNAAHTAIYGNTLMGGAVLGPSQPDDPNIVYYPIEPLVKFDVVDPRQPDRRVAIGETGQVSVTVLSEERFLPRVLERDQAERWHALPALGCEGVANVRPLAKMQASATEGVY
jgi:phenylacetate-coenzyme A ligase PaaK-like adenylate-forming protein